MPMPLDDDPADLPPPPRGSLARGLVLHKLLEEVLTGELPEDAAALQARAAELATQLDDTPGADTLDAAEAARTALQGLALPEIHAVRDRLVPECTVAASKTTPDAERVTLGVADAVVEEADGTLSLVVDWKSDVDPAPETVGALSCPGCNVYGSLWRPGRITGVPDRGPRGTRRPARSLTWRSLRCPNPPSLSTFSRRSTGRSGPAGPRHTRPFREGAAAERRLFAAGAEGEWCGARPRRLVGNGLPFRLAVRRRKDVMPRRQTR